MKGNGLYATAFVVMAIVLSAAPASAAPADDAWDQFLSGPPGPPRFTVLMGPTCQGTAVRDNETGLVWERSPDPGAFVWGADPLLPISFGAHEMCNNKVVCGRRGWRLPGVQEMTSLGGCSSTDASGACSPPASFNLPQLPHPFIIPAGFLGTFLWTSTTSTNGTASEQSAPCFPPIFPCGSHTTHAWTVAFGGGGTSGVGKDTLNHAWCVRFRQGPELQ